MVGGPLGAAAGGLITEGGRQAFRKFVGPEELGPQSLPAAYTEQAMAGAGGLFGPEAAAAKFPLGARMGAMGEMVPPRMKYGEAKNIMDTGYETGVGMGGRFKLERSALTDAFRKEQAEAQVAFNQRVASNIEPLRQEQTRMFNVKSKNSAQLNYDRKIAAREQTQQLSALNESVTKAKEQVSTKVAEEVGLFTKSVGREMTKSEIADGTFLARQRGWGAYTQQESKLYKEVKDIFRKNPSKTPTGEMVESSTLGPDGKPIMVEVMRERFGAFDRSEIQKNLKQFAEMHREDLIIARQNQSPGASTILDIVDGPAIVDGETALNDMAALNKFGWGKADAIVRTPGESIVRDVANQYREALKESIGKLKVDGKKALSKLEEAKQLISERDRIFKTGSGIITGKPVARGVGESVAASGKVYDLVNDPKRLRALYGSIDDETRQGMTRQITEEVLGKNPKDFAKNWTGGIDDEVKRIVYSPDEIARMDKLAQMGPTMLNDIANDALVQNARIIKDTTDKLNAIAQGQMGLADTTVNARNLRTRIRLETDELKRAKLEKALDLNLRAAEARKLLTEQQNAARQNHAIRIKQARQRMEEIRGLKKKVFIGGSIVGAGVIKWKANEIGTLLGLPGFE
jgi:hypothetical protein